MSEVSCCPMMMARDVYDYDSVEWPHNSASLWCCDRSKITMHICCGGGGGGESCDLFKSSQISRVACAGAEIRAFFAFYGKNWWASKNYKNNIEVEGAKFFCRDASIMTNDNCPALQVNCKLFPFLVISKTTNEYVFSYMAHLNSCWRYNLLT